MIFVEDVPVAPNCRLPKKDLDNGQLESCLFCEQHWISGEEVITRPAPSSYAVATLLLEDLVGFCAFVVRGTDRCVSRIPTESDLLICSKLRTGFVELKIQPKQESPQAHALVLHECV